MHTICGHKYSANIQCICTWYIHLVQIYSKYIYSLYILCIHTVYTIHKRRPYSTYRRHQTETFTFCSVLSMKHSVLCGMWITVLDILSHCPYWEVGVKVTCWEEKLQSLIVAGRKDLPKSFLAYLGGMSLQLKSLLDITACRGWIQLFKCSSVLPSSSSVSELCLLRSESVL